MNTWNKMHYFMKVGLISDFLSLVVFAIKILTDGPFILIAIQLGLLGGALFFITIGALKMRKAYNEYNGELTND